MTGLSLAILVVVVVGSVIAVLAGVYVVALVRAWRRYAAEVAGRWSVTEAGQIVAGVDGPYVLPVGSTWVQADKLAQWVRATTTPEVNDSLTQADRQRPAHPETAPTCTTRTRQPRLDDSEPPGEVPDEGGEEQARMRRAWRDALLDFADEPTFQAMRAAGQASFTSVVLDQLAARRAAHDESHDEAGRLTPGDDAAAEVVHARFSSRQDGQWAATVEQLAEQPGVIVAATHDAARRLREVLPTRDIRVDDVLARGVVLVYAADRLPERLRREDQ